MINYHQNKTRLSKNMKFKKYFTGTFTEQTLISHSNEMK